VCTLGLYKATYRCCCWYYGSEYALTCLPPLGLITWVPMIPDLSNKDRRPRCRGKAGCDYQVSIVGKGNVTKAA